MIASVRSAELFSLAVLLAVLASAWATHAVGLSLALGAFLAGMMLAETEFRHQVEATIRSYREVLLGAVFHHRWHAARRRLAVAHLPLVTAILVGMLLLKAAVVAVVAKPATKSWFKSLRTGVVVAQGGEFGFALLILLLRKSIARSGDRAAAAGGDGVEHGVIAADHPPQPAHHPRHPARDGQSANRGHAQEQRNFGGRRSGARGDLRFWPRRTKHCARAGADGFRVHRTRRGSSPNSHRPPGRRPGGLRRRRPGQSVGERRRGARQRGGDHVCKSGRRVAHLASGARTARRRAHPGAHAGRHQARRSCRPPAPRRSCPKRSRPA